LVTQHAAPPISGTNNPEGLLARHGFAGKVLEFGQEDCVDYGRVAQASKDFFFKACPRAAERDTPVTDPGAGVPRNLLFVATVVE